MSLSRVIRIAGWIYICATPAVLLLIAWLTLGAFLSDFREWMIMLGVFVLVGFVSLATDVYMELKQTILRSRIVYDLAIGFFGWCVLVGYLLYRLFF